VIDTTATAGLESGQLGIKINEIESQPPLLGELQLIPNVAHFYTWHMFHDYPFCANWIDRFRAICKDCWDRYRSATYDHLFIGKSSQKRPVFRLLRTKSIAATSFSVLKSGFTGATKRAITLRDGS
jgi:hypothetical protein